MYYDLDRQFVVLYDNATLKRNRLSLFAETGYEFFIGPEFSIEISGGVGVKSIQNDYRFVENPLQLNDVIPLRHKDDDRYKYIGTNWIGAGNFTLRFGWRIF